MKLQERCRLLFDGSLCISGKMEIPTENQFEKSKGEELKILYDQEEETRVRRKKDEEEETREVEASPRRKVDDVWERKVLLMMK